VITIKYLLVYVSVKIESHDVQRFIDEFPHPQYHIYLVHRISFPPSLEHWAMGGYGNIFCSPTFFWNYTLTTLLRHSAWWIRVCAYFHKLWLTAQYSIDCSLVDDTTLNTLLCLGGMISLNTVSKLLRIADLMATMSSSDNNNPPLTPPLIEESVPLWSLIGYKCPSISNDDCNTSNKRISDRVECRASELDESW
jgi:hypothetical protein